MYIYVFSYNLFAKYPLGAYYVPDAVQGVGVTEVKKTWSFNIQET